jgi:tRNA-binding EMAP/Myf-like protein
VVVGRSSLVLAGQHVGTIGPRVKRVCTPGKGVGWYPTYLVEPRPLIVVGLVNKVRPHPNGECIWLADVDVGEEYERQIIWGGQPLVEEGCFVPVALPGARLPQGKIRRRRYRGEISDGMLCSLAELGWDLSASDRVALLKPVGLNPGASLEKVGLDWQKIAL